MALLIASNLLVEIFLKRLRKIYSSLVGKTDQYPQHIGKLITQIMVSVCRLG